MTKLEEELFAAVEVGDVAGVTRLIRLNPNINLDVKDRLGRTPLNLATNNEHEEVVKVLINKSSDIDIYDSLLLATSIESTTIAEVILEHEKWPSVKVNCQGLAAPLNHRSTYPPNMTPLVMAAQQNCYSVVRKLLDSGDMLEKPHPAVCECKTCLDEIRNSDRLTRAKSRLARWKALTSEAYISLSSSDPILTAFIISRELHRISRLEGHYKEEYEILVDKLKRYPGDLLDHIRSDEEATHVMNRGTKALCHTHREKPPKELARIKLAMHFDQKRFVAHAMSHRKVTNVMYGELNYLQGSRPLNRLLYILGFLVLYPVFLFSYLFFPCSVIGRAMKIPIVKLTSHALLYLTFLCLVVAFSFIEKSDVWENRVEDLPEVKKAFNKFISSDGVMFEHEINKLHIRKEKPSALYMLICLYIAGNLFGRCIQLYNNGIKTYAERFYNLLDTVALGCYLIAIACKFYVYLMKSTVECYFLKEESWRSLVQEDKVAMKYFTLFIADRYFWTSSDPEYIAEGFFSIANILSFIKGTYLLSLSQQLGPLQLSMGRMVKDIIRFTCILLIFMVGFLVALHNLYWYFSPVIINASYIPTQTEYNTALNSAGVANFGGFSLSIQTIFWAIFGMDNSDSTSLDVFHAEFTETIGVLLFGIYNWIMVVLLLNMLIAIMSKSLDYITMDKDLEWKYGVTVLYMDYIQHYATLPPPFNLIPNPKWVFKLVTCRRFKHPGQHRTEQNQYENNNQNNLSMSVKGSQINRNDPYEEVIKQIVERYIRHQMKNKNTVSVIELKQDVSSFRYEVLNSLKSSNNDVKEQFESIRREQKNINDKLDFLVSSVVRSPSEMTENSSIYTDETSL